MILLLAACADITPVDDGQAVADLVILKDWFTSVQLLDAGDRVILFDGGYRPGKVRRQLEGQGFAPEEVTDVFLTHGHTDHLGMVPELPNATVYAFAEEAERIDEESKGEVSIDRPLVDGEVIALGDTTIEVFAMPGHTAGSAVYLTAGGALVLGDSARRTRDGSLIVSDGKNTEDFDENIANLRALADALEPRADAVRWLVPAHTAPIEGFGPLRDL